MKSRSAPVRLGAVILALSAGLAGPSASAAGPPAAAAGSPSRAAATSTKESSGASRVVTLITGDRVTVTGDRVGVEPGPGRRHVSFRTLRTKGRVTVIPSDVSGEVAAGKLDRRLFDVTGLLEARYDDAASPVIPLIVTYKNRAKRSVPAGTALTRELASINGTAVKVAKKDTAKFLAGLAAARPAGVSKIWLDGKRRPTLDSSVPQIDAPAAWEAGLTGKDVPVAVLDTGIDATHPDLADRVAGSKNFTEDPPEDLHGHGTHVASTIAGTNSKYRGVAPDAKVFAGKVCEGADGLCPESMVLAGMEWAATEVKARVVNLSLGGGDTPELDPMEEAVNRLTEQTGTLFVIAAGNSGPGERTVGSPGSAEAALTVGAVDKQDKLAEFSSRGPRIGDDGLKPDVVAPGVAITAARAGGGHQVMSGTSMATPHAAGAAAILAQQHPDWKAADLKAALMASAKPLDGLTPFEQGTGRIDVAQATKQEVLVAPYRIPFGVALWPHADDKPVTKQLTYRNRGDQPITLNLATTLTGPDSKPAPESALKLSTTEVTIPAGGSSTVNVTSDTRHTGPDGTYTGRVTATAPGVSLTTTLTVTKEIESYTLTVTMIPPDNNPSSSSDVFLYRHDDGWNDSFLIDGTVQRRLPKGRYMIDGFHITDPWAGPDSLAYLALQQSLTIAGDTAVTLDMRKAKPFDITIPAPDAKPGLADLTYRLPDGSSFQLVAPDPRKVFTAQVGPPLPAGQFASYISTQWAKPDAAGDFAQSPYVYSTMDRFPGSFPTGLTRQVTPADLAVVDQTLHHTSHTDGSAHLSGVVPGFHLPSATLNIAYTLPAKRRLHLDKSDTAWATDLAEWEDEHLDPVSVAVRPWRTYSVGRVTRERINVAAFTPTPVAATRISDQLSVRLSPTTDATGARGVTAADSQSTRLLRGGTELAKSDVFHQLGVTGLPAEPAKYTIESALDRSSTAKFATKVDARWTFTSSADHKTVPLLGVRYQPEVDDNNTAARAAVTTLPVVIDPVPGTKLPSLRTTTLEYSGDNGTTWKKATLYKTKAGQYRAVFPTPKDAKNVSLKLHATDAAGNTTDLTTIAAYHLR